MLPKRNLGPREVMRQMEKRHKKRADATKSVAKLKGALILVFATG